MNVSRDEQGINIIEILLCNENPQSDLLQYGSKIPKLILRAYYTACSRINDNVKNAFATYEKLIGINAMLGKKFFENFRPLHFAVKYQLLDIITTLIENGVGVEDTNSYGMTALHCAVQNTQMGLLKEDLSKIRLLDGDYLDCRSSSNLFASRLIKVIELLLKHGSNVNATDHFGRTPIFYLYDRLIQQTELKEPRKSIIDLLESFSKMCHFGYYQIVDHSLGCARRHIIRLLLSLSPALDITDHGGNTILHSLAKAGNFLGNYSDGGIVEAYLSGGGDVNALNHEGLTALHYTCGNHFTKLMDILLTHGADVNLTRHQEMERPIHRAALFLRFCHDLLETSKFKMVERLLKHGAHVDAAMSDGATAILLASEALPKPPNNLLLTCLLNWGCDLDCRDSLGRTPLHRVCLGGNWSMVQSFLLHGADLNAVDCEGHTPITIAFDAPLPYSIGTLYAFGEYVDQQMILGYPLCMANRMRLRFSNLNSPWSFKTMCRGEVEVMRCAHVDARTTLYDILHRDSDFLIPRLRSQRLTSIVFDPNFDEVYLIYGYLLKVKMTKARKRAELLRRARESLKAILNFEGLDTCLDVIVSHLKRNNDLINLIDAKAFVTIKDVTEGDSTKVA